MRQNCDTDRGSDNILKEPQTPGFLKGGFIGYCQKLYERNHRESESD